MQSILSNLDSLILTIGFDEFECHDLVINLSHRLNIHPRQVIRGFVGLVLLLALIFLIRFADQILLFIVGVLYPAYETIKIRNSSLGFEKGARTWLIYWVCFGVLSCLHGVFRVVLKEVPFLHLFECGILVWLYHRKTCGVEVINSTVFAPLIKKYGKVVDKQLDQVKETLQKKVS